MVTAMSQRLLAAVLSTAVLSATLVSAVDSEAEAMLADLLGRTNVPAVEPVVIAPIDQSDRPEQPELEAPVPIEPPKLPAAPPEQLEETAARAEPIQETAAPAEATSAVAAAAGPETGTAAMAEAETGTEVPVPLAPPELPLAPPELPLAPPEQPEEITTAAEATSAVAAAVGPEAVTAAVAEAEAEAPAAGEVATGVRPGTLVGRVTDHKGRPLPSVKMVLFNDESYREMRSTPRGNFGFSVTSAMEYTLTAMLENQFFFTNMFLKPAQGAAVLVRFQVPINVYGNLIIDGLPAQQGLLLRCINAKGAQAGGIVVSNGYFTIKNLTPGNYTMVFERRKRFIDKRLDENRFYYINVALTNDTARIIVDRDRRRLTGHVVIDGLPQRHTDAVVVLKDAQTKGLLIHREMYSYYQEGYFVFDHVPPGAYTLQATQAQREWRTPEVPVYVKASDRVVRVTLDVSPDPDRHAKELRNLQRHFIRD
jgi:hypothetical protein